MRVFCEHDESMPDTWCFFCGQGFVMHLEGQNPEDRTLALAVVEHMLAEHHRNNQQQYDLQPQAHPEEGFILQQTMRRIPLEDSALVGKNPYGIL